MASSKKTAIISISVLVVVLAIATLVYPLVANSASGDAPAPSSDSPSSSAIAAPGTWNAPELAACHIDDAAGACHELGEIADGKLTVINVWATWCPYCIKDLPAFQCLYDKYGDRVAFIMLNSADDGDEVENGKAYIEEAGFSFPVYYDCEDGIMNHFKVTALPTTIVIAADGEVLSCAAGMIDAEALDKALADLLVS